MKGQTTKKTDVARALQERKQGQTPRENEPGGAWEWIKSFVVAVVLWFLISTFLVKAYTIPSGSMEQTLLVGDYLMANNAVYGAKVPLLPLRTPAFRDPEHGEIVVFRPTYNTPQMDVVKRVIGEPGDTIQMIDRVLYRNGERLDEPYVDPAYSGDEPIPYSGQGVPLSPEIDPRRYGYHWHLDALPEGVDPATYRPTRDQWGPLIVPEDRYLLLGDNRDQSLDSRFMGFIPRDEIRGKAMFIYYSVDRGQGRPFPQFLTSARWGRIGSLIR